MGDTCRDLWAATGKYHSIKAPWDAYYRVFNEGAYQLDAHEMTAGERVVATASVRANPGCTAPHLPCVTSSDPMS